MERLALFLSRSDVFLSVSPEEGQEIAQALMELGPGVDLPGVGGDLPPELEVRNLLALWWVVLSLPDHTHEANLVRETFEPHGIFYARLRDAFASLPRLAGDPLHSGAPWSALLGFLDAFTWLLRCIPLFNSALCTSSAASAELFFDLLGHGALATVPPCKPFSGDQQAEILRALSNLVPWLREDERSNSMGPLGLEVRAYSTSLFLSFYAAAHNREGSTIPPVVTEALLYYANPRNLGEILSKWHSIPCREKYSVGRIVRFVFELGLCLVPYCSPLDRLYQQDTANVLALAKMVGSLPFADVVAIIGTPNLEIMILSQNLASALLDRGPSSYFHGLFQTLVEDVICDPSSDSLVSLAMFMSFDSKFRFHFADRIRSRPARFNPFVKSLLRIASNDAMSTIKRSAAGVLLEALDMRSVAQMESYRLFLEAIASGRCLSKSLPTAADRASLTLDHVLSSCFAFCHCDAANVDMGSASELGTLILHALPLIRRYLGRCEGGSEPPPPLLLLQALTNLVRSLGGILRAKQRLLVGKLRRDLRNIRRLEKAASDGRIAIRLQVFRERSRVAEVRSQLDQIGQAAGEVRGLCGQLRVLGQEAMREVYFGGIGLL